MKQKTINQVYNEYVSKHNQPATPSPSNTEQVEVFTGNATDGLFLKMQLGTSIAFENKTDFLCSDGTKLFSIIFEHYVVPKRRTIIEAEILSAPALKSENNRLKADNKVLLEALQDIASDYDFFY